MCPNIVINNEILHSIRNDFILNTNAITVFNKFNNIESIDKFVDERVISTNAWFPICSGKPDDNDDYYKITHRYNVKVNANKITLEKSTVPKITVNLIKKYSNYKKNYLSKLTPILI